MPLFPYKLHELLTEMQSSPHLSSIISWVPSGNAFKIHQPELFQEILLKKYFPRQTKINSFKRQLLYYGFDNLGDCIFAHPCFLKGKRHLCGQINHSNPTKSQREAKASIPSRRIRGKRAKQALRHKLIKAPECDVINEAVNVGPMPPATTSFGPAAPLLGANFSLPLPNISNNGETPFSFTQALLQSRTSPMEYWGRMNSANTPPLTTSGMGNSSMQKEENLPLSQSIMIQMNQMSGQSRMALAKLLQQRTGTNGGGLQGGLHAVSA